MGDGGQDPLFAIVLEDVRTKVTLKTTHLTPHKSNSRDLIAVKRKKTKTLESTL